MEDSPQSLAAMGDFTESPTMDLGGTSRTLRGRACQGTALAAFTVENGTLVLDINTDSELDALKSGLGLVVKAVDLEIKADLQVANNIAGAGLATAASHVSRWEPGKKITIAGFQVGGRHVPLRQRCQRSAAAQLSQISSDGQPAQIDAEGYVTPLSLIP